MIDSTLSLGYSSTYNIITLILPLSDKDALDFLYCMLVLGGAPCKHEGMLVGVSWDVFTLTCTFSSLARHVL